MKFKVGLMGASLYTGNRGVSALGASLATLIWRSRPDAAISLLIGNQDARSVEVCVDGGFRSVETVNYRLSPRATVRQQLWWIVLMSFLYRLVSSEGARRWIAGTCPWIQSVVGTDFVGDIRGGDSFSDIYGTKGFMLGSLPVLSVIWIRGGIHLLPQTYGPFRSKFAQRLARYILLNAESIWCRDSISLGEISRLTGGQRKGTLCPDVAFALDANRPVAPAIEPPLPAQGCTRLIGLNVSGLMYHQGQRSANPFGLTLDYSVFLRRLVEQVLADESNRVLLVPHTISLGEPPDADPPACRDLIQAVTPSVRDRVHLVVKDYDQHQIKGIIGMCDFFIGSRMHACIAALSQGIPTVGVAYSRKFSGVFETVGAADWVIDGRTDPVEVALGRVKDLFSERHLIRAILRERAAGAQNQLSRIFEGLVGGQQRRWLQSCDRTDS